MPDTTDVKRGSKAAENQSLRQARRWQRDTRFDALRPRSRRRALVAGSAAALFALTLGLLLSWHGAVTIVLGALLLVGVWGLRIATRLAADAPDAALDERQRVVRDRLYRFAYHTLSAAVMVTLLVLYIGTDSERIVGANVGRTMHAVLWLFVFGAVLLPPALLAWNEREI